MTLDHDSAILTLPPSPPESRLLVEREPGGARHPYSMAQASASDTNGPFL